MVQDANITKLSKSGKQLFADDQGEPGLPTIFFMHGLGSSHTFYQAALSLSSLKQKYRVIRYDFDGHGLSPFSGARSFSIDSLVEDLRELMDDCDVRAAAGIVGHSMSGLVATSFAAKYPDRVQKLFLIGPMKAMAPAGQEVMLKRAETVTTAGLSAIVDAVVNSATSAATKANSPLSLALIRSLVLGTGIEGYAAACRALAGASEPDYSAIKAEVLVLGGAEDYLSSPELITGLVQALPRASQVSLPHVGHWHAVEAPAEVARQLDEFFA